MATFLVKLENKVQIPHLHPMCSLMVKRSRKSVQEIGKKYTETRRKHATQFPSVSLFSAETTGPNFTKIFHDVMTLVALNHAYTRRYHIPFLNARVTKVRSLPFFTKLVAMVTPLEISEKYVQIVHLRPKRFHSVLRLQKSVQRILR